MINSEKKSTIKEGKCLWCKSKTSLAISCFDTLYGIPGKRDYYFCPQCHSYSIYPVPSEKELTHFYETYYPLDNEITLLNRGFLHRLWQRLDGQDCLGEILKPGSVLDIGCGNGSLLATAQNMGHEVWGQEFNPVTLKSLEQKGFKVTDKPITSDYFPRQYFTNVVLSQVIEHVPDPVQLLRDILPLLNDQGQIIISTPNPQSLLAKIFKNHWIAWHPPFHLCLISVSALTDIAKQLNLKCTKVSKRTRSWYFHVSFCSYRYGKEGEINTHIYQGLSLWKKLILIPWLRLIDLLGWGNDTIVVLSKE